MNLLEVFKQSPFIKRFLKNKAAVISLGLFIIVLMISLGAPFIANDRPILMSYNGSLYSPVLFKYLPKDFGKEGFVVDYFAIEEEIENDGWMIFPPIKQRPFEQNLNFDSLPAPPGSNTIVLEDEVDGGIKLHHVLGTDTGGRDLLTRLIYACRTSLVMATLITLLSLIIGVLLGSVMGYIGGNFDIIVGRLLEAVGYFPIIFLIIILVAFIPDPSNLFIVFIFAIVGFSPFAFYMRGQVLKTRKMTYIEAARALGQSDWRIMFQHILPNSVGPIIVMIPFNITMNITFLATIDFLGFGVQPPTASLGILLRSGYDELVNRWWLVASSSVLLVFILLLVNFIGEGVRDGFDPKSLINQKKIDDLEEEHGARLDGASS